MPWRRNRTAPPPATRGFGSRLAHGILELADVAGPSMGQELCLRVRGEPGGLGARAQRVRGQEMLREGEDVDRPIPQRRNGQVGHVKPVEEVLPEAAFGDCLRERARALFPCTCLATISLPVPVSPVMRTVASVGATCSRLVRRSCESGSSKTKARARHCGASNRGNSRTGMGSQRGLSTTRRIYVQ